MTLEGQGRADCWGNTWSGSGIVFLQLADEALLQIVGGDKLIIPFC